MLGQSSPVNLIHSIKAFKPMQVILLTNERPESDQIDQWETSIAQDQDQLRKELYHECRVWWWGG